MLLLAILTAFSPASARAEVPENQYVYLQALGGALAPLDDRQSAALGVGASLGFRTSPFFTLGGFFYYSTQSLQVVTAEASVENFAFGGEFVYWAKDLDGFEGLNLGVKSGFTYRFFESASVISGVPVREESGRLNFVLGPKVGFEHTLDVGLGFGGEAFILYDFADGRMGPLGVMASVRVWF
jgi:hypothetical protein